MTITTPCAKRSELHAKRLIKRETERPIPDMVRRYHLEGYTPLQIARILRMPILDVRLAVQQLPALPRYAYRRAS